MSSVVKNSKFRHVYADTPKPEFCYSGLRLATATGEQCYIKANTKFFCVAVEGGGGAMAVIPHSQVGRQTAPFKIAGHSGPVLDFDFNPFHEQLLASASDDTTIKIWGIPENGLTENMTEPLVNLTGHQRKVTLLRFHPTANNVIASCSGDFTIKQWDIEAGGECGTPYQGFENLIQDIVWNYDGSMLASSSKDKQMRLFDPRTGQVTASVEAHEGSKTSKLCFLGRLGLLASCGFTKRSTRQIKTWDPRKLETPLKCLDMDQSAGVLMPFYDADCNIMYVGGKGDGNVKYFEMQSDGGIFPLSTYSSNVAQKGLCMVPKRSLDVMKTEHCRMLKLHAKSIEPLSFRVPRKSEMFQEDLYPESYAGVAVHASAQDWLQGEDKQPVLMSVDPAKAGGASGVKKVMVAPKTNSQLSKELKTAEARIAELEKLLKDNNISC
jgi:coronin-1B/1C/6